MTPPLTFGQARACLILAIGCLALFSARAVAVDFEAELKPLLESRCLGCHNPNVSKADISLSSAEEVIQEGKSLVVPGRPDESDLYLAVLPDSVSGKADMPKEGDPLSEQEIGLLRRWIEEGAHWPEGLVLRETSKADRSWWAYQPLAERHHDSIDAFIDEKLTEEGLERNPPADRRTLIRRATYDLTGLPPTADQVDAFVEDQDPQAYARLVDRLLDSPHYGERWGRHWLDVVRFGESIGFERNVIIDDLWPFRDYVIRSINEDKPFDQMIREHLAGDVLEVDDPEVVIGSAFLVAGPYDDVGNQDPKAQAQIRANTLDEIINATGEAFLGMTLGCARCHDHKFDPISQRDYYRMYATFAGVRHGRASLATSADREARATALAPLEAKKKALEEEVNAIEAAVSARAEARRAAYEADWIRPTVDRRGTEEIFDPTLASQVRLICEAADFNPKGRNFTIDEFEVWSHEDTSRNVALASNGGEAFGKARVNEDFPGVYGPSLAIDGLTGARFLSASDTLTIKFREPTTIHRIVFSNARGVANPGEGYLGAFPADYRIEASLDGESWAEIAHGRDRKPVHDAHRQHRLRLGEITAEDRRQLAQHRKALRAVSDEISKIPRLKQAWIGLRDAGGADGPFHVFVGGNPQRKGEKVLPASLSTLDEVTTAYDLGEGASEGARRVALAEWITHPDNPLTPRVLANRLWHYHFGRGIVDTPNDFGYMGGKPTHPELLDYLATALKENDWKLKDLHRMIMLSKVYRQASTYRASAAEQDGDSRLLWRFPPRRLSAEEIRDTMLAVCGVLDPKMGGRGFRLYRYMNDNVSTYEPLDRHGPETYRRAVYHQNARASVVDLMTEFDQPDCAFSSPSRVKTTTPLQALTMLNHAFTVDMAEALSQRIEEIVTEERGKRDEVGVLIRLAYQREPSEEETTQLGRAIKTVGLRAVCRAVLNSSELIYAD